MAEYIEREAVCYQLEKQESIDGQPRAIRRARRIVADFPAADVVPVVRGRWKWYDSFSYRCSACKKYWIAPGDQYDYHYCPNCGALMDKDGDGE